MLSVYRKFLIISLLRWALFSNLTMESVVSVLTMNPVRTSRVSICHNFVLSSIFLRVEERGQKRNCYGS